MVIFQESMLRFRFCLYCLPSDQDQGTEELIQRETVSRLTGLVPVPSFHCALFDHKLIFVYHIEGRLCLCQVPSDRHLEKYRDLNISGTTREDAGTMSSSHGYFRTSLAWNLDFTTIRRGRLKNRPASLEHAES
jgi:hypothetical protein